MIKPIVMILAVALAAGCQSNSNSEAEQAQATQQAAEQPTQERQVRQRSEPAAAPVTREAARPQAGTSIDPANQLPRLRGELSSDGFGLEMPIDGSSPENFLQSLELIAAESSEAQYQRFEQAMVHLRRSEPAYSDLRVMYSSFDGMTPAEVIERFEQQLRERVRR